MRKELQTTFRQNDLIFDSKVDVKNVFVKLTRFFFNNAKYIQLCLDLLLLTVSVYLSSLILPEDSSLYFLGKHMSGEIIFAVVWLFFASAKSSGLYDDLLLKDSEVIIRGVLKSWVLFFVICTFLYLLLLKNVFEYEKFFLSLGIFSLLLFMNRLLFLSFRKKNRDKVIKNKNIVIIGSNHYSDHLQNCINKGTFAYKILGLYSHDINLFGKEGEDSEISRFQKAGVEEIFCCMSSFQKEELQQLVFEADKHMIRVKFLPEFNNLLSKSASISNLGDIPVISVRREPLLIERNIFLKRTFDFVFAAFVMIFVFSWLFPILILIIKLDSKGPAFFKQKRSGRDNKSFSCYKFRTMVVNNGADKMQASKNDARITKVGSFLRKTSLDEFPQFFNVLKGNMSIVGPRPHMLSHTEKYKGEVDAYMVRHFVKPGITGWAQVNGFRGETKQLSQMYKRIEHDVWYMENWSFMLDMKIIFLTVWNIFKGEENAF